MLKERSPAWDLPVNTVIYFGLVHVTISGGADADEDDFRQFHYLYLCVKRASKYCNSLWDDIIRETTEALNEPDNDKLSCHGGAEGEVRGADNPYVILAVGVEIRLFQWDQGFDDSVAGAARRQKSPSSFLRELKPGETFSFLEKTGREEIERFVHASEQHMEKIKETFSRARADEVD